MRVAEARQIRSLLCSLEIEAGAVCLNIGSSTELFRKVDKPHIESELIQPLQALGIQIVHVDIKSGRGIDLAGDVLDPRFQTELRALNANVVLCCNLLEHLSDPYSFALSCGSLVRPGGFIVVSVPFSFPMHNDPIDNMLRPTPEEICEMFPGWGLREGRIVESGSYLKDLMKRRDWLAVLTRNIGAVFLPFLSKGAWRPRAQRLLWLFRPYKISVAVLEKLAD